MKKMVLDHKAYEETARQAVAEGQVLLINEEHTLPLQKGTDLPCLAEFSSIIIKVEPVREAW